jgi:hypothetical protein
MKEQKRIPNLQAALEFGIGLGYTFPYLDKELQKHLLTEKAERNPKLACGLGMGLSYAFSSLGEAQAQLFEKAERNSEFAEGLLICWFRWIFCSK